MDQKFFRPVTVRSLCGPGPASSGFVPKLPGSRNLINSRMRLAEGFFLPKVRLKWIRNFSGRSRCGPCPVPLRFPFEVFEDPNDDLSTSFAMTCAGYKENFQNEINWTTISRDRDFFRFFEKIDKI